MKIKSEFYTKEIALLVRGIQIQLYECEKTAAQIKKQAQISSCFMFWRKNAIWSEALMKSNFVLTSALELREIRDKLMQSEGIDEDMQPITFEKIICDQNLWKISA